MTDGQRHDSIYQWEKMIYPIWNKIETAEFAADNARYEQDPTYKEEVLYDCRLTHKQDLSIHRSGFKPNRTDENQEKMYSLRAKAAKAAGIGAY